ncbi:hypothetical protein BWQ96_05923 [Gracilariopsis chorda]|uniref:Uncharacterized protein n=1 Tax=Gracilariopsis chorda TaxID=448386 RepID=A0A2V3IQC7_9FLOR|nr:hypothetical protein BWQ96_05923 [Gracilariopsis chorda]|eukprot:PXF44296.1 hypothetical protein BWQ96_05923 [Gracilariopsis chorda]
MSNMPPCTASSQRDNTTYPGTFLESIQYSYQKAFKSSRPRSYCRYTSAKRPFSYKSFFRATPNTASLVASTPRLLQFPVTLKKDAVGYELQKDGGQSNSCTRNTVSRRALVELSGEKLDPSVFDVANAFVIDVEDWEKHCPAVQPVDEADDMLFYVSDEVSVNGSQVYLVMSIVSGAAIAPEIEIDASENPAFVNALPNTVVFRDSLIQPVHWRRVLTSSYRVSTGRTCCLQKNVAGSSTFTVNDELNAEASINGFIGVCPTVRVEFTLGKEGIEGNIGAIMRLEVDTRIKNPAYAACTGSGS